MQKIAYMIGFSLKKELRLKRFLIGFYSHFPDVYTFMGNRVYFYGKNVFLIISYNLCINYEREMSMH